MSARQEKETAHALKSRPRPGREFRGNQACNAVLAIGNAPVDRNGKAFDVHMGEPIRKGGRMPQVLHHVATHDGGDVTSLGEGQRRDFGAEIHMVQDGTVPTVRAGELGGVEELVDREVVRPRAGAVCAGAGMLIRTHGLRAPLRR